MLERIRSRHKEVIQLILNLPIKDQSVALHVYHGAYQEDRHRNGSYFGLESSEYHVKMVKRANSMEQALTDYIDAHKTITDLTENFSEAHRGMVFSAFNNAGYEYNDTTEISRVQFMEERAKATLDYVEDRLTELSQKLA